MSKQVERRFVRAEVRASAEGEPAKIKGYGAVFNSQSENLGWSTELREEIDAHAFDGVLATNPDVRGLFNHDSNFVLGRTTAGTMRLSVDARGLAYEIDPPDTQFARDLMVSMRRGDITGSSFAFTVKRDQWTDNPDGSISRRILEFDELLDVSPVTYPAYPATSAQARSLPSSCPVELRSRLEAGACQCDCPECAADDCENCSNPLCTDDGCDCEQDGERAKAALAETRALRVQVAAAISALA